MAIDKRKFNGQSFLGQVPMDLLREFLAPWQTRLKGLDLDNLTREGFFAYLVSGDCCPGDVSEALHRMNDVCGRDCRDRIIALADATGCTEEVLGGKQAPPMTELVMRAHLHAREEVFDKIWDQEYLHTLSFPYDRLSIDERPLEVTGAKIEVLRKRVSQLLDEQHRGEYCTVRHYADEDGDYFIVRHGWWPERHEVLTEGRENIIHFQPLRQDIIHYDAERGKLRMKTVTRKEEEQDALRDAFAEIMLGDKDLFRHDKAEQLYTLEPLQRDGTAFRFTAGLDQGDQVRVVEVKVARGRQGKRVVTCVANKEDVLAELEQGWEKVDLQADELISAKLAFRLVRDGRVVRRTVLIKPPSVCDFNTATHADTIWDLLNRNGFLLYQAQAGAA